MSAGRKPHIIGASPGRNHGPMGDDQRGSVVVSIVYRALKAQPIDQTLLTPAQARKVAIDLLQAADAADITAAGLRSDG